MHGIGGSSSGAIAAFTVAWERPDDFRKVLSNVGSFVNLRGAGTSTRRRCWRPRRNRSGCFFATDGTTQPRPPHGPIRRDPRLVLPERPADEGPRAEGLRRELVPGGMNNHGQKFGGAILPEMMRWLWRDGLGVHRPERQAGAGLQPARREEVMTANSFRLHVTPHRPTDWLVTMTSSDRSRRSFLKTSVALAGTTPLIAGSLRAQSGNVARPLIAYVGTFQFLLSAMCCRRRWTCPRATAAASTCSG